MMYTKEGNAVLLQMQKHRIFDPVLLRDLIEADAALSAAIVQALYAARIGVIRDANGRPTHAILDLQSLLAAEPE